MEQAEVINLKEAVDQMKKGIPDWCLFIGEMKNDREQLHYTRFESE